MCLLHDSQWARMVISLRSKRFRGAKFSAFCPREKWGESKNRKEGVGEGSEGNARGQTPWFWKPPFASERSSWLAGLVKHYWHVSIKGLKVPERTFEACLQKALTLLTERVLVVSFDSTVEILSCNANALVVRNLTITADAIATQFAAVPLILASLSWMSTCAKDEIIGSLRSYYGGAVYNVD